MGLATAGLLAGVLILGTVLFANLVSYLLAGDLAAVVDLEMSVIADAVTEEGPEGLAGIAWDDSFRVQLVGPDGQLLYDQSAPSGSGPMSDARPAVGDRQVEGLRSWWQPWDREPAWIVAVQGVEHGGTSYTAIVGKSQEQSQRAVDSMVVLMLLLAPLIVLLGTVVARRLVGGALRPVDEIRSRVESVSASNLSERVEVAQTGDEIEQLGLTMNRMLARLEQAQVSQRQFTADASHELRSPVASIAGALDVVERNPSLETWEELTPLIRAETRRLESTVANLLLLAGVDDHRSKPEFKDVDLDDLVLLETTALRQRWGGTVVTELEPVRILGDANKLDQVIRNLVDNAARHAVGRIGVEVRREPGFGVVVVCDDGLGIDPEDRERVFDRFVRLDESRSRDAGGSGLGLAIVKEVVRAHGGSVSVTRSPDLGGAEFIVRLPATPA